MSVFKYECPHCLKAIEAPESAYGQQVECPLCQKAILLPPKPVDTGAKTARLLKVDSDSPSSEPSGTGGMEPETDVFSIRPAARAFLVQLLAGLGLVGVGVGAAAWFYSQKPNSNWWLALALVLMGVVLWLWVWLQTRMCSYHMTTQRLITTQGILGQRMDELELFRVKDLVVRQSLPQRLLGYGSIVLLTTDSSNPQIELLAVPKPREFKESIRNQVRAARHREGLRPMELMETK